jgi:hypothetical protein
MTTASELRRGDHDGAQRFPPWHPSAVLVPMRQRARNPSRVARGKGDAVQVSERQQKAVPELGREADRGEEALRHPQLSLLS